MIDASLHYELFFQSPHIYDPQQEVRSTLYLLRRDIYTCYGYDPNNESKLENEALFPATMGVMAGIDLLAKFVYLDDEQGKMKSGTRFVRFVERYIDSEHANALYQLRNSLLHSFGLYSKCNSGKEYRFILDRGRARMVEARNSVVYIVDIMILWKGFENSINQVKSDLINELDWEERFMQMFTRYGTLVTRPI